MIVGAGPLQVPAIVRAKELGYTVMAVDRDPKAPGFAIADVPIAASTNDIPAVVAWAKKLKPHGVMTLATDLPVRTCAAVAQALGLCGLSEATARVVTDKGEMRLALAASGIPIPRFAICSSKAEYMAAVERFPDRFIVKPADNSGSRGVTLVTNPGQAPAAYAYSQEFSRSGRVLVEEYMVGDEVSAETFSVDGHVHVIAVTDKITSHAPYFVELGHTVPSSKEPASVAQIEDLARAAVQALGVCQGPTHCEIMVTADGPKIVEIGARLAGDNIATHLVPLATGISLVDLTIEQALGEPLVIPKRQAAAAAIRYLTPTPGRVAGICGVDEAKALPGVAAVALNVAVDDWVGPVRNSNDRSGYVIARAENAAAAGEVCVKACRMIEITTVPEHSADRTQ